MATFSLLVLRTRDLEASLRFYSALGLQFQQEQHGYGPIHYSAASGEAILELYPLKNGQSEPDDSTMIGFQVAGIIEVLDELGVEAEIRSSEWGRFCSIKDPDGRTVRLSE